MDDLELLRLKPMYQPRVWGGDRLDPSSTEPIGEAWVVYEGNTVDGGRWADQTLADVTTILGRRLLGEAVFDRTGERFPILIKLLHSRDWLSVQVHPNDEQALRLEGADMFGKTEAWHVLEADSGAQVVFGLADDLEVEDLRALAERDSFEEVLRYVAVAAGDTLFTPAGTVHAIGPGLFIYEVQQVSDITYRLFDWNRRAEDGRELHLDKGLDVIHTGANETSVHRTHTDDSAREVVAACEYFALERIPVTVDGVTIRTGQLSFHAVTAIEGSVSVACAGSAVTLATLESAVVPATSGEYVLSSPDGATVLVAYVPELGVV